MDINTLSYFIAVCKYKSFSQAANELFISHPALSRKISGLEEELGYELLLRTKPALTLTQAGELALARAREIVAARDRLLLELECSGENRTFVLRLGYVNVCQLKWIADLTAMLKQLCPTIDVQVSRLYLPTLRNMLRAGELDAIFDMCFVDSLPGELCYKAYPSRLYVALSPGHPKAGCSELRLSELSGDTLSIFSREIAPDVFDYLTQLCKEQGFVPRTTRCYDTPEALIMSVATGQGVTITDGSTRIFEAANTVFIPVADHESKMLWVLVWNPDHVNPAIRFLKEAVSRVNP